MKLERSIDNDGWIVTTGGVEYYAPDSGGMWTLNRRGEPGRRVFGTSDFRIGRSMRSAIRSLRAVWPDDLSEEAWDEMEADAQSVGKPAKAPDGAAATERIELRVTPAQKDRIRELADVEGASITDYVLSRVL